MNLEVGKKYVLSDGVVARCICVDRAIQNQLGAILLYTGKYETERTFCCKVDGSPHYDGIGTRSVVKEYKEPIKVRVFVWRGVRGGILSMSISDQKVISNPASYWGFTDASKVLSDTIIEVEDKA
jgi:hypothetical protein